MKRSSVFLLIGLATLLFTGAGCGQSPDGGVFRSDNSAQTWQQKTFVSKQKNNSVVTINDVNVVTLVLYPKDSNIVYLGSNGKGLYISLNGGEQWTQSSQIKTGKVSSIAIDPLTPTTIYLALNNTVQKSIDQGITWQIIYTDVKNATITNVVVDNYDDSRIYVATSSGQILKSYDYGIHWEPHFQQTGSVIELLMPKHDSRILYALMSNGTIYKTINAAEFDNAQSNSATLINSGWSKLLDDNFKKHFTGVDKVTYLTLDSLDSSVIYLTSKRGLMKGIADGTDWSDMVTVLGANDSRNALIRNVVVAPDPVQTMYFTLGNTIHKSIDHGNTWQVIDHFPSVRNIAVFIVDFDTPTTLYAGMASPPQQKGFFQVQSTNS